MSRFWGGSSSSSEDDEPETSNRVATTTRFAAHAMDSDSEDEGARVVKSKKDRLIETMVDEINTLKNKLKIADWEKVEASYIALNKILEKNTKDLVDGLGKPPNVYLKCISELNKIVTAAWGTRKTLSKLRGKALTNIKTGLKRKLKENDLETHIEAFEKKAEQGEVDSEEEDGGEDVEEDESEPESPKAVSPTAQPKMPIFERDEDNAKIDEDDEDDWGTDDDSDVSDFEGIEGAEGFPYKASMFLKNTDKSAGGKSKKDVKQEEKQRLALEKEKAKKKLEIERQNNEAAARLAGDTEEFQEIGKGGRRKKGKNNMFNKDDEITVGLCVQKLEEFVSQRGRKGITVADQMAQLRVLRTIGDANRLGAGLSALIKLQIISLHFDNIKSVATHMDDKSWRCCHDDVVELIQLLSTSPNLVLDPKHDDENMVEDKGSGYLLQGDVVSFVERLDNENIKSLRSTDPHSIDYVHRLKNEVIVYNLICMCEKYIKSIHKGKGGPKHGFTNELKRIQLLRVEHLYYKREYVPNLKHLELMREEDKQEIEKYKTEDQKKKERDAMANSTAAVPPKEIPVHIDLEVERDSEKLMRDLCKNMYTSDTEDRVRTRAVLCHIYHHALHDRWYDARDMMLMSHLQELIMQSDINTQILYNRAMVQLGLCAFRQGMVWEAHTALHDIWAGSKVKELLAQGIVHQRNQEKTPEEIRVEQQRQTPFHMHINTEMLECVYYICSMLLEIPNMARADTGHRRFISKPFRRQLDYYRRNTFTGPPENARDHVMAAAIAMASGDWQKCNKLLMALRIWKLFPKEQKVKDMLLQKIKEESLRTYLLTYGGVYESISLQSLSETFEIELSLVHGIVSKMIIEEDLQASHDQPTQTIEMHKEELSVLQTLSIQFADKATQFVENNERQFEYRLGNFNQDNRGGGRGRGRGGRGMSRGRGGRGRNYEGGSKKFHVRFNNNNRLDNKNKD